MRVLAINGSPRPDGNTSIALAEMQGVFDTSGVEMETLRIGSQAIRGCISCGHCKQAGSCMFDDVVNEAADTFERADGLVVATPVYYGSANATTVAFLDRLFYSTSFDKTMKVGAAVAVARRAGTSATYDEVNKYFAISGMPIATGQYWNGIFGRERGEANQDVEGLQQMRTLARNMAFLMRSIVLGRRELGLPEREAPQSMSFVH